MKLVPPVNKKYSTVKYVKNLCICKQNLIKTNNFLVLIPNYVSQGTSGPVVFILTKFDSVFKFGDKEVLITGIKCVKKSSKLKNNICS